MPTCEDCGDDRERLIPVRDVPLAYRDGVGYDRWLCPDCNKDRDGRWDGYPERRTITPARRYR